MNEHSPGSIPPVQPTPQVLPPGNPRKKYRGWLIAIFSTFAVLAVLLCMALMILFGSRGKENLDVNDENALSVMETKKGFEVASAAFEKPYREFDQTDQTRIIQTIDRMMTASSEYDYDQTRSMINKSGFINQMIRSGEWPSENIIEKMVIKQTFSIVTDGPPAYEHFRVVSIKRLNNREALAHIYFWDYPQEVTEARWWLVRQGSSWQVADWESLREGATEAEQYAILVQHQDDASVQAFYDAMTEVSAFYENTDYDRPAAEERLRTVEQMSLHPKLADYTNMMVARGWAYIEEWDEAEIAASKIADANKVPAKHYLLADVSRGREEHEKALQHIDRYAQIMGDTPPVWRMRLDCYSELNQNDEAFEAVVALAKAMPEDEYALQRLGQLVTPDDAKQLDRIKEIPGIEKIAVEAIDESYDLASIPLLRVIEKILRDNEDNPGGSDFAAAKRAELQHDLELAAKHYELAISKSQSTNAQERYEDDRAEMFFSVGQPLRAYKAATDKSVPMQRLVSGIFDDEFELSPKQLEELTQSYRSTEPDDPITNMLEGKLATQKRR